MVYWGHNNPMKIAFDIAKNCRNIAKHGLPLTAALGFRRETALEIADLRYEYGEDRFQAIGFIGTRLHVMVFTTRGDVVRVISLRRANRREIRYYADER